MMAVQRRFAADYGMPEGTVRQLVALAGMAGRFNERSCNGTVHPRSVNKEDKNENSRHWQDGLGRITEKIAELVESYGFTAVAYNGLYPSLKRGSQFVEIPY